MGVLFKTEKRRESGVEQKNPGLSGMGINPTLNDILLFLNRIAPLPMAEDWDNPGLQVGDLSLKVRKILTSLDPDLSVVREASARKAELILTHHPLIFRSISSVNRKIYPGDVIFEACEAGIAIVALHTNLDMAQGGINDMLASLFQLKNVEVLQKNPVHLLSGLGRIGDLPVSEPLFSFAQRIKPLLGTELLAMSGSNDKRVKRVAVVGGSGGNLVPLAFEMNADVLITGDVSHHDALRARSLGLALIDAGHFQTEKTAFALFANRLKELINQEGWDVVVETYEEERNPLQWI
ncbi:MAG: Nif3-like dinuclear metal center hexameric protein [Deltaproteobacteria bacterium]|nr:Nif3-like dinuclear metal center hexameric protein [Deltaproteobacteria bacterium]